MRFLCSTRRPASRSGLRATRAPAMAEVTLHQVSKRFGPIEAVRDLSFAIDNGEFVVLLGPSGAGKTTTLRLITGLERPDAGSISIDGRDVTQDPPGTRDIAFVFQQYSLYPHLSVYDNLAFPLRSPARRKRRSASASNRPQNFFTLPASSATRRRGSPVARCSGLPSAVRWCAIPRST